MKVAQLLLEHNADPLACDKQGRNPLHLAVVTRRPGLVEALLAKGADPLQKDMAGDGALHTLLRWQKPAPVPMSEGTDKVHKVSEVALHSKASTVHCETSQLLCTHLTKEDPPPWPIVDTKGAAGETALHIAVRHHHKDVSVSLLTQFFASTDIADDSGALPLAACTAKGYPSEIAQAITSAEANRTVPMPKKPLAEELEENIREGNSADVIALLQNEVCISLCLGCCLSLHATCFSLIRLLSTRSSITLVPQVSLQSDRKIASKQTQGRGSRSLPHLWAMQMRLRLFFREEWPMLTARTPLVVVCSMSLPLEATSPR